MSNRKRRKWLRDARVRQLVAADRGDELDHFMESYPEDEIDSFTAEYKYRVRSLFSSIARPPLESSDGHFGEDALGGSLVALQRRNVRRQFDLLRDNLDELAYQNDRCNLWSDYRDVVESACLVFNQARKVLAPLRRVSLPGCPEQQWTATISRAARSLSWQRKPVFQYASHDGSVLASARRFWKELEPLDGWNSPPLAERDVYALLAMDQAHLAVKSVLELLATFDHWAVDELISDDDLDTFRDGVAPWERLGSRYAFWRLLQGKDLLHLAQLSFKDGSIEELREARTSLEREIQRRSDALEAAEPLVEKGRKFTNPPKRGRDALSDILTEILRRNGKSTEAEAVLKLMRNYVGRGVIQEIEEDKTIRWLSRSGKEKTTKFHTLESRLSELRKEI